MTAPIYAIGDIHGHLDLFEAALDLVRDDGGAKAEIVFLGDYIDRGLSSRQVIERLMSGQDAGLPWTCLMGNHEEVLLGFLADPGYHSPHNAAVIPYLHPSAGGREALASYGVDTDPHRADAGIHADALRAIPKRHIDWITGLPRVRETPDHIFVHAGLRPGLPLADQDPGDLLWIRAGFLDDETDHGRLVIHGHTPVAQPERHRNRINCDGGATFRRPILPVRLQGRQAYLLTPEGAHPL